MTQFTPLAATLGGALIGLAAVILMAGNGRIAGISGIVRAVLPPFSGSVAGSAAFVAGLLAAPILYQLATHTTIQQTVSANLALIIGAGLLVGVGTTLGGGCTSGHGVCGLGRFSVRSLAAVATFMAAAVITVFITRHVMGG